MPGDPPAQRDCVGWEVPGKVNLLWRPRFGDAPRYAAPAGAHTASEARERAQTMAAQSASRVPLELIGLVTPLPAGGGPVPGTVIEHQAQVGAYETALDRLGEAARHVDVVVPGHGAVAEGPEVAARLAADHAYIDALRRGEEPVDARLGQDWLSGPHQSNLEQARHSNG